MYFYKQISVLLDPKIYYGDVRQFQLGNNSPKFAIKRRAQFKALINLDVRELYSPEVTVS